MWSPSGDIIHPDGTIERGSELITINRRQLFARRDTGRREHPLVLTRIRCLSDDIAVADGKWELRGVLDTSGKPLPTMEGQVTLVLKRTGGMADRGVSLHASSPGGRADRADAGAQAPRRAPDLK